MYLTEILYSAYLFTMDPGNVYQALLCAGAGALKMSAVWPSPQGAVFCEGYCRLSFPFVMGFTTDVTSNFVESSWLFQPLFPISVTS